MADFKSYIPILKKWEGGFVNNPNDPGGATFCGVTLATYRVFYGKSKTVEDLKKMTEGEWRSIMKTYWDSVKGDNITNQSIANICADFAVNAGAYGRKAIQRALGCVADGIFGEKTLSAINKGTQECVFCKIKKARIKYYEDLVRSKPSQLVFLTGWLNRTNYFTFKD